MAYPDFQCMLDDPPGLRNYWTAEHLADMPDDAIEAIAGRAEQMPVGPSQMLIVAWGGAIGRVGEDSSPLGGRDTAFVVHPFALWEDAADDERAIAWARAFRGDLSDHATGAVYLNFAGEEGQARVRSGFAPGAYERLARVKAEWDPDDVFHATGHVPPAA
jgi:FAD/FMN-containing dehydrogenase